MLLRMLRGAALVASVLFVPALASAATITFNLDYEFSGAFEPQGPTPWVVITIDDSVGGANDVQVTMTALNLTGGQSGESIKQIYLNLDPALDPTQLTFNAVNTSAVASVGTSTGTNAFMADGDGNFDILFDFPPPPGSDAARFTDDEQVEYILSYPSPISASSFDYSSEEGGGNGSYRAAAHVQRIGGVESNSGWIGAVPEPGTALLVGLGLIGLGLSRRS